MKKIVTLILAVFVLGFSFLPVNSAFAYSGGLLDGKSLMRGSSINGTEGGASSTLTDRDLTSGVNLSISAYKYDYYSFSQDMTIDSYIAKANGTVGIAFYDVNGNLLSTLHSIDRTYVKTSITPVNKVRTVAIFNDYNTNITVYEFDVFGSAYSSPHDELSNLVVTPFYNNVTLEWDPPINNPDFNGSRIYRNGTLIKTLDKNTNFFTDYTVQATTTYTYKVSGSYSDGFETTGVTKTTTTLEAPKPVGDVTNIKEDPSYNQVNLTWDNPTDANFNKVKIYRDGVFLSESTGTSFKDDTVKAETNYEYKITTISTDGLESGGVTTTVMTLKEPIPAIVAGGYTTDENGNYLFSWTEPTTGKVKILIDGKDYKTVDASLLKVLIPSADMKYDYVGNPKVSLIPISSSGIVGEPIKPEPVSGTSPGLNIPFNVNDLVGSGVGLLWFIGPLILLVLAFILVPKLRTLIFKSLPKVKKSEDPVNDKGKIKRRFEANEINVKDQQDKAQSEIQEKERLERKQRQEKEYLERIVRQEGKEIEKAAIIREPKHPRQSKFRFTRAERAIREQRDPRIPREPRIPRDRTRPTRTPRAERER